MRDGIAGGIAGRQSRARTQYNWSAADSDESENEERQSARLWPRFVFCKCSAAKHQVPFSYLLNYSHFVPFFCVAFEGRARRVRDSIKKKRMRAALDGAN